MELKKKEQYQIISLTATINKLKDERVRLGRRNQNSNNGTSYNNNQSNQSKSNSNSKNQDNKNSDLRFKEKWTWKKIVLKNGGPPVKKFLDKTYH